MTATGFRKAVQVFLPSSYTRAKFIHPAFHFTVYSLKGVSPGLHITLVLSPRSTLLPTENVPRAFSIPWKGFSISCV